MNTRLDVVIILIVSACMLCKVCTGPIDICEEQPGGHPCQEDEKC